MNVLFGRPLFIFLFFLQCQSWKSESRPGWERNRVAVFSLPKNQACLQMKCFHHAGCELNRTGKIRQYLNCFASRYPLIEPVSERLMVLNWNIIKFRLLKHFDFEFDLIFEFVNLCIHTKVKRHTFTYHVNWIYSKCSSSFVQVGLWV